MTGFACHLFFNMALVVEQDMFGEVKYLAPRYGPVIFKVRDLIFNLGMARNDMIMAEQAFFNRWNPGMDGPVHKGMAEFAVDGLMARMQTVAERNRLFRTQTGHRMCIKKIDKPHHQDDSGAG